MTETQLYMILVRVPKEQKEENHRLTLKTAVEKGILTRFNQVEIVEISKAS